MGFMISQASMFMNYVLPKHVARMDKYLQSLSHDITLKNTFIPTGE